MLQCTRVVIVTGRPVVPPGTGIGTGTPGPAPPAPLDPVCVASTSMFSGYAVAPSRNVRSGVTPPTPAKSAVLLVNSRVTSTTAALSGPYASTFNTVMIAPGFSASTAR